MSLQESTVKMKDYFTTKHNVTSILALILEADHNLKQLSWPPAGPELSFAQPPGPGASHRRMVGKCRDLQKPMLASHPEEWASPYDSLTWEILTMLSIPQICSLLETQPQQGSGSCYFHLAAVSSHSNFSDCRFSPSTPPHLLVHCHCPIAAWSLTQGKAMARLWITWIGCPELTTMGGLWRLLLSWRLSRPLHQAVLLLREWWRL